MKRSSLKEVLFVFTLAVAFIVMSVPAMADGPFTGRHNPNGPIIWLDEHPWGGDMKPVSSSVAPAVDNQPNDTQLDQGNEVVPLFTPPWRNDPFGIIIWLGDHPWGGDQVADD